jgi:hypothetical protein
MLGFCLKQKSKMLASACGLFHSARLPRLRASRGGYIEYPPSMRSNLQGGQKPNMLAHPFRVKLRGGVHRVPPLDDLTLRWQSHLSNSINRIKLRKQLIG